LGTGAKSKAGKGFCFDGSGSETEVQWIETEISRRAEQRCSGAVMVSRAKIIVRNQVHSISQ